MILIGQKRHLLLLIPGNKLLSCFFCFVFLGGGEGYRLIFFLNLTASVKLYIMVVLQDALEFVGWELIGVISQAIVDGVDSDTFQECNKILYLIAEVSKKIRGS